MEEKKLDPFQLIGFVLIAGILAWMFYNNSAEQQKKEVQQKVANTENQVTKQPQTPQPNISQISTDTLISSNIEAKLGVFAYASVQRDNPAFTILENDKLYIKVSNKGGTIAEVQLKEFVDYQKNPLYLIRNHNSNFNINFSTTDNHNLDTQDLFFEPSLTKENDTQVLSMKLKTSETTYLEYRYELPEASYMLDFVVRSKGLSDVFDVSKNPNLYWELKAIRQEKSVTYENRYTQLTYQYDKDRVSELSAAGSDDEKVEGVSWISFRQHFFSSILLGDTPFKSVSINSEDLVENEEAETPFTKAYSASIPLSYSEGEINYTMDYYFGPTDLKIMREYKRDIEASIPFGWGIFGWINKYVFTPLFGFLASFLPYGIAIIVMTIVVRIVLSPVLYKSYVSQAKMKVLKPEITAINEKYKNDAIKKQQATMKLWNKAGVSPMSGCIPALIQMPVFYALFLFFPTAFALRQKSFLWAEDLASYDTIFEWTTHIPLVSSFYGNHISLFPILASIAIFFYMLMTTGQQMSTQQPGMPNMKFIMYLSPVIMLIFFNNYASGLSLYYFISNLLMVGIMLVIKNYVIDEAKIHEKIEAHKKKPKKQNRFQRKMQEMMEQAQVQQQQNAKRKR